MIINVKFEEQNTTFGGNFAESEQSFSANIKDLQIIDNSGIKEETDPTVPEWAKQPEKL